MHAANETKNKKHSKNTSQMTTHTYKKKTQKKTHIYTHKQKATDQTFSLVSVNIKINSIKIKIKIIKLKLKKSKIQAKKIIKNHRNWVILLQVYLVVHRLNYLRQ